MSEQFISTPNAKLGERSFEKVVAGTAFEAARPIQSKLSAIVFRKDGRVEDLGVIATRYVSTAFCTEIAKAMTGNSASVTRIQAYKYHCWGSTGTGTAEDKSQDACIAPVSPTNTAAAFVEGTQTNPSATTFRSVATITADGSTGGSIAEHCIHCDTTTGAYGLDRSAFAAITVSSGDSIQFTYTLTIASDDPT